jgi:hypothetical protein
VCGTVTRLGRRGRYLSIKRVNCGGDGTGVSHQGPGKPAWGPADTAWRRADQSGMMVTEVGSKHHYRHSRGGGDNHRPETRQMPREREREKNMASDHGRRLDRCGFGIRCTLVQSMEGRRNMTFQPSALQGEQPPKEEGIYQHRLRQFVVCKKDVVCN